MVMGICIMMLRALRQFSRKITIAVSFILLNAFGFSSNIMSLTGVALAIGVIVDNGIIMSENSYRSLAEWQNSQQPGKT